MRTTFGIILFGILVGLGVVNLIAVAAAAVKDDPGPVLKYGGTSIELHYEAPGANVTKVLVDGTPCIIVSDGYDKYLTDPPVIALSCNWGAR